MSGATWTLADVQNTSTRPGIYENFIGTARTAVQVGAQGVVAICGSADWGPLNATITVTAEDQILDALGSGGSLPLLVGQALRGGASQVIAYRTGVSGTAASATLTLVAADASGAAVLLTSKYPGARANNFTVKISTNAADPSKKDLTLLESGTVLEIYTHTANDDLVSAIGGHTVGVNASRYLAATVQGANGRALANNGAGVAMTGGNSGTALTANEYTISMTALETQSFNLFVPGDTTNSSIQASVRAWTDRLYNEGKKFLSVMGGQSVVGMDAATLSTEFQAVRTLSMGTTVGNHDHVAYCFPGIVDELSGVALSGAQSAARAAGMIAKQGFASSVTKMDTGAADVTARMVNSDVKLGLQSGLLLFTVEGSRVVIEQGINSLTTFTLARDRTFRKIRQTRTLDAIAVALASAATSSLIGKVNNDKTGRAFAISLIVDTLHVFENAGAIEPGSTVDPDNSRPADPDEFFVKVGVTPIDSLEKLFITTQVL